MRQQNKSPLGCSSSQADDGGKNLLAENFFSAANFNPESANCQSWRSRQIAENTIAELLQCGAESAIPARVLLETSSCKSRRELFRKINRERNSGIMILANRKGFFLPSENPTRARAEIESWISTQSTKSASIQQTLKWARDILRQCDGQASFPEVVSNAETESS